MGDTVKNYQAKKEALVLGLVKKYPLYSVDKLNGELPEISRHSIQRILEKNNLSTVEKRLAFVDDQRAGVLTEKPKLRLGFRDKLHFSPERLRERLESLKFEPKAQLNWRSSRNLALGGVVILLLWLGAGFILAKPPEIVLEQPEAGFVNQGEKLFVIGRVVPLSRVTVSGEAVSLNGDGSFTAVVNIPMGESVLEIEATNKRAKAKVLRLVKRVPTQEELQAQEEKKAAKKQEAANKAAETERAVNDLLASKKTVMSPEGGQQGLLRVLNNRVEEEAGFTRIVGEVVNLGKEAVSWVLITARFLDKGGQVVDTKYGFATDFGEVLKSEEKAEFETQATLKQFDHYTLELSWEEESVAGVATESGERTETETETE